MNFGFGGGRLRGAGNSLRSRQVTGWTNACFEASTSFMGIDMTCGWSATRKAPRGDLEIGE